MTERKMTIWSSEIDIDEWRESLLSENPDITEDELYLIADEINGDYLDDERDMLSDLKGEPIIIIGDLGFWFGRRNGYKMIPSGSVADCLYSEEDFVEWYVDEHDEFRARVADHDGSSGYLYRRLKENLSPRQIENFQDKILKGQADSKVLARYSRKIGKEILSVYGLA